MLCILNETDWTEAHQNDKNHDKHSNIVVYTYITIYEFYFLQQFKAYSYIRLSTLEALEFLKILALVTVTVDSV